MVQRHRWVEDMIELRDLVPDDVHRLYRWRQEPEVDNWLFEHPPAEFEAHQAWFDAFMADDDRAGWIIMQHGEPSGFLNLIGVTNFKRRARWNWYIGEPVARGRGAGRAAQALGLERAFDQLGLQKVWSEIHAANEPALRAQAAAGFRREGYLRRHSFKRGDYRDVILLAILAEEWTCRRERVLADLQKSGLIR